MALLLDTHILVDLLEGRLERHGKVVGNLVEDGTDQLIVSVATLWEINIKWRLGKLPMSVVPGELPALIRNLGIDLLPITEHHALAAVEPEPETRDPFDRMLLAQCAAEGLKLVTVDRALAGHPLAAG